MLLPNQDSVVPGGHCKRTFAGEKAISVAGQALILKYYLILDFVDLLRISFRTITDLLF